MSATESIDAAHTISNNDFEKVRVLLQHLLDKVDVKQHVNMLAQATGCFIARDFVGLVGHLNTVEWDDECTSLLNSMARITLTDTGLQDLGIPLDVRVSVEAINLFADEESAVVCAACGSTDTTFDGIDDGYNEEKQCHTTSRTFTCNDCKHHTVFSFHLAEVKVEDGPG